MPCVYTGELGHRLAHYLPVPSVSCLELPWNQRAYSLLPGERMVDGPHPVTNVYRKNFKSHLQEAEAVVQWTKLLPCRHKDLSSVPLLPYIVRFVFSLSVPTPKKETETGKPPRAQGQLAWCMQL